MLFTIKNVANAKSFYLRERVEGQDIEIRVNTKKSKMELFVNGSRKCKYKLGNLNAFDKAKKCV